jgi:hypothetical protein
MATRAEINAHLATLGSDAEKRAYLNGLIEEKTIGAGKTLSKVEGISPQSTFEAPIRIPEPPMGPQMGKGELDTGISPEQLTDLIPGAAGAAGTVLGGPLLAGPLSAGGEAVRQLIRRSVGAPQATGFGQEALGLDPNSPEAALVSILGEGVGGAAMELLPFIGKGAVKGTRRSALKSAVEGLADTSSMSKQQLKSMMDDLAPVAADLPGPGFNPFRARKNAISYLNDQSNLAGKEVKRVYGKNAMPIDSGLIEDAVEQRVRKGAASKEFTEGFQFTMPSGKTVDIAPTFKGDFAKSEAKQLNIRANKMAAKIRAKGLLDEDFTVMDLYELRREAARDAKKASRKAFKLGSPDQPVPAKATAALEERSALSDILHSEVEGGAEVDAIYSAFKAAQGMAETGGQSHFLERWALSRIVGGVGGTVVGAAAQTPVFWKLLAAKGKRGLANALEFGGETGAQQWLRGFAQSLKNEEDTNE